MGSGGKFGDVVVAWTRAPRTGKFGRNHRYRETGAFPVTTLTGRYDSEPPETQDLPDFYGLEIERWAA